MVYASDAVEKVGFLQLQKTPKISAGDYLIYTSITYRLNALQTRTTQDSAPIPEGPSPALGKCKIYH